jgi:hypothetical protein
VFCSIKNLLVIWFSATSQHQFDWQWWFQYLLHLTQQQWWQWNNLHIFTHSCNHGIRPIISLWERSVTMESQQLDETTGWNSFFCIEINGNESILTHAICLLQSAIASCAASNWLLALSCSGCPHPPSCRWCAPMSRFCAAVVVCMWCHHDALNLSSQRLLLALKCHHCACAADGWQTEKFWSYNPNYFQWYGKCVKLLAHGKNQVFCNSQRLNLVTFLLPIPCECNPQTPLSID